MLPFLSGIHVNLPHYAISIHMKTKERILEVALSLFNDRGVSAVSSKHISDEMGISYGNLCYHFPKKDDIILRLYLNMQEELDRHFRVMQQEIYGFDFMVGSLRDILETLLKYKFVYLGFTRITRQFDEVRRHAMMQFENRRRMLRDMIDFLLGKGYLHAEHVEGHYDRLIHLMQFMLNFWIGDSETFYKGEDDGKVRYYLELFYSFMRPSLTQKGIDAFNEAYLRRKSS
jgi:AcrR family transcriptional regulator